MIYHLLFCFASVVLDLMVAAGVAAEDKDLEIAVLRQQLRVVERKTSARTRLSRPEKLMLVALADKLKCVTVPVDGSNHSLMFNHISNDALFDKVVVLDKPIKIEGLER